MSEYIPTIGLEIHAELKTQTKMFCSSKNDSDETRANVNICPVCLAHPGTLPVINREAVRHVLRVGAALNATLADYTEFDRKNYFYPDLPKGYQLSQYEHPLVSGGELAGVAITRVHLEEDTASSVHDDVSGSTVIDFNRAGVPLMELVTEPVMHDAETVGGFARELQLLLRALNVSSANMEKGEMRVEANISVAKTGAPLGTKVEVKNLNSFNSMERAIRYEIKRQSALLEKGERVEQETRGWDDAKQATFVQRVKEGSADYRYFPDPDLPSLRLSEFEDLRHETLKASLPELPAQKRARYLSLGLKAEDAELFARDPVLGAFFDTATGGLPAADKALLLSANFIANDLVGITSSNWEVKRDSDARDSRNQPEIPISPEHFRKIVGMVANAKISSRAGKDILATYAKGETRDPEVYATEENLLQDHSSGRIASVVADVVRANSGVVEDFRKGKEAALQFLIGQSMKALKGAADPAALRAELQEQIRKLG